MAIDPVWTGYEYLAGKLRADATLILLAPNPKVASRANVHRERVPRSSQRALSLPAIVMFHNRETPLMVIGDDIVWYQPIFGVKVVNVAQDEERTKAIVNRVATLLHQSTGSATDASIIRTTQMNSFSNPETSQADHYDHVGSFWSLLIQE